MWNCSIASKVTTPTTKSKEIIKKSVTDKRKPFQLCCVIKRITRSVTAYL